MAHHQIVIVGGGTAGLSTASLLKVKNPSLDIAIIDPSKKHYYQPLWTLVGAGLFPKEETERNQADYIPAGTQWIPEYVSGFDPEHNKVLLKNGESVSYDYLVVAAGIQVDWGKIPGLKESVGQPGTGVVSNYSYDSVEMTWQNIKALKPGDTALFTHPSGLIKCGGAPIKIAFLASHHLQKKGILDRVTVKFIKGGPGIFAVKKYADSLTKVADDYGMERIWKHDLVAINAEKKEATFKNKETGEQQVEKYTMIHVSPPMSAPAFIRESKLGDKYGWVEVDKLTTQHVRYPNIFSLGDCSSLPTSKTGAAIRKQVPVTVENLLAVINHKTPAKEYDGYTSCPLVTGYDSLIMAEFDYDKQPAETFPFDQSRPRYSMFALKAYGLPRMYWHGMLRGREF